MNYVTNIEDETTLRDDVYLFNISVNTYKFKVYCVNDDCYLKIVFFKKYFTAKYSSLKVNDEIEGNKNQKCGSTACKNCGVLLIKIKYLD